MKYLFIFAVLVALMGGLKGGESSLTVTYQPLNGLGSGNIVISQVTCHDWHSHSGQATAIGLISESNVPPGNNPKEVTQDVNLASVCGVRFSTSDLGDPKAAPELALDATDFVIPKESGYPREQIIRSCLECLRRCLPEKLRDTPVRLKASESDKIWLSKIVREFNDHDRRKVFYIPQS